MRNLPPELMYVVLFFAVVLFQYLMKRRSTPEPREAPEVEQVDDWQADAESALPIVNILQAAWPVPHASLEQARPDLTSAISYAGAPRRFSRQSLLRTRRDVQNAVVIAAILGPCRALQPWE